jgi:Uma2 family endonuclease
MVAAPTSGSPSAPPDPRFPGLRPEVVAGYLQAPDTMVAEVIDGELSVMPRPRRQHARAAGELHGELRNPFDRGRGGPGGWVFLPEPELHLGPKPDIVVPDLAGWRRARVPEDFLAEDAPAHVDLVPDWVCEVISERTQAQDRGKKRRVYRREGVGHYWLVDPRDRTVEVYRLENGRWVEVDTYEGDATVRAEPFEAVEIDLSALWKL